MPQQLAPLVTALLSRQSVLGMSDSAFAAHLGIDHSMWSRLKSGQRRGGRRTLQAVARVFPELKPLILDYVAGGNGDRPEE